MQATRPLHSVQGSPRVSLAPLPVRSRNMFALHFHPPVSVPIRCAEGSQDKPLKLSASPRQVHDCFPKELAVDDVSRREVLALAGVALSSAAASPAFAASERELLRNYPAVTSKLHGMLEDVLVMDIGPARSERVAELKTMSNQWVADYRRLISQKRKSFSETYAVVNSLMGHMATFGPERPLPPKLTASISKRLNSAELALTREA